MNSFLKPYVRIEITGKLKEDVTSLFENYNDKKTLNHVLKVANESIRVAERFGVNKTYAEQAALLHDISNVIPVNEMMEVAIRLNVKVEEKEHKYPRIIHQKLSRAMAEDIFEVTNQEVLEAIECHTTLKPNASQLDKVLFISDKISWELPGEHTYLLRIREQVESNELDQAILIYLNHVWEQRANLKLVHPWLIEARKEILWATQGGQ